jgi:enoyl-CoA hydratase/carnithine racemase
VADYKTIKIERQARVALVTLNRPDSLNALNAEVMSEIAAVFGEIDRALPHRGGPPALLVRRFPRSGVHAATSSQ